MTDDKAKKPSGTYFSLGFGSSFTFHFYIPNDIQLVWQHSAMRGLWNNSLTTVLEYAPF